MNIHFKNWRLFSERGRQVWKYIGIDEVNTNALDEAFRFDKKKNPNSGDLVYRSNAEDSYAGENYSEDFFQQFSAEEKAYLKAVHFYAKLQAEDGHWPGDYGGPHFLLPGLVICSYVTESEFDERRAVLMKRYMLNHQNEDGGWGLHIEGKSTLFGTVLQYVALRILGMSADENEIVRARNWIIKHGGATGVPSWGKFYLAILGLFEWDGCNSLLPELWLLPMSIPIHPGRYWCHTRMVYLPMSYCFGHRFRGRETTLIKELREEIYTKPYDKIQWKNVRNECAATDLYFPQPGLLKIMNKIINVYEKSPVKAWRRKALKFILDYIDAEDDHTNFINIGPVNQVINSICVFHAYGKESERFCQHRNRWDDYLWLAEDGMKMNGYNGSQLWDTAFATQAILENPKLAAHFKSTLQKAYSYFDLTQIKEEVRDRELYFRHLSVGGWPFSTVDHGWPITDCSAEGFKVSLALNKSGWIDPTIDKERLKRTIDLILSFQNKSGGWASYELMRSPGWLEWINPAEIFGGIMVDYPYTECSSACIQALSYAPLLDAEYRKDEIAESIQKGIAFIRKEQRDDGSWYGSWAVCFTYGTWFGVEALVHASVPTYTSRNPDPAIRKACEFLVSKQNQDGGWGESFESCVYKKYVPHAESQVVNTAWALLTLMSANYPDLKVIRSGIEFLMKMQDDKGDWPQQGISGVFNHNCMITYTAYRNVFPIWALARYTAMYETKK